jgi:transposase-like protein
MSKQKSRRKTPWEGDAELTATQKFLKQQYDLFYAERHRRVVDSNEADMINSYVPVKCPYCTAEKFKKSGHTKSGIQRYMCNECGKTFLPTTGTIFDEHRISISEWTEYCLNLFGHVSITADSWNNKNTFKTSRYWLQKVFLTLEGVQDNIVLSGEVWYDETFYTVRSENIVRKDNGDKLRGVSQNQICIGVATDKRQTVLLVEGVGKPSQKKTSETFRNHIEKGSTLIHDEEAAHKKLITELSLRSKTFSSKELKGLPDKDNPLNPVNRVHDILKKFLNAHSGFDRSELQNWLNLFAFISNPPDDFLEKVDLIVNLAFQNPKLLRYRDFYGVNTGLEE